MSELALIEENTAVALFNDSKKMDEALKKIETEVMSFVPDLSTAKGRKEVASMSYKVRQSKTLIDKAGKDLVADWKAKAKLVDDDRKKTREFLDELAAKVRKPLDEWEQEQERITEEKRLAEELEAAHIQAIAENELFDREKAIAEKERIAREAEEERIRFAEAERLEAERLEQERIMKEEAAEQAKIAAEKAAEEAIEKVKRELEAEAEKAKQAEVARLLAIEKAKEAKEQAERERLEAIEQAEQEKQAAIKAEQERSAQEAREKEQALLAKEAEAKRIAEKLASNRAHMKKCNESALKSFIDNDIDEKTAKKIINLIYKKKITYITINY